MIVMTRIQIEMNFENSMGKYNIRIQDILIVLCEEFYVLMYLDLRLLTLKVTHRYIIRLCEQSKCQTCLCLT